ncbi:HDOD domain-containing protein [Massilia sp.]|uniref:HDOD domain-containing protein n=1 Tax=Massilia sp. TaxID=1882437 RepID=UPI0028A0AC17|nr:HDOD domain-containing protein [Massilia sp.]
MADIPQDGAARRVRPALLRKVAGNDAMFALGTAVARVIEMTSSSDRGTQDLALHVMSDLALTQRILRLSNAVQYRTAGGNQVTTVSRAISLLGFDNVRSAALAMLLVDALDGGQQDAAVRGELEAALCASMVGREMARISPYKGAEEASICCLFKNLGPLLVASHEYDRYREIAALVAAGKYTPAQASQLILGCSYAALAEAVLVEWDIPELIVRAQAALAPGPLPVAEDRSEWMCQVASFGIDIARLMGKSHEPARSPEVAALLERYGAALELDQEGLETLFGTVQEGMTAMLQSLSFERATKSDTPPADGLPGVLMLASLDAGADDEDEFHSSGKPKNAAERLLAGLQEVTLLRGSGKAAMHEVALAALSTLHGAMGFRFSTLCLRDARSSQYRARAALGESAAALQAGFAFPAAARRDLFHLALENDADMMIADAFSPKIRDLLPAWYKTLLPDAESFIVLPLVVNKVPLGLFYADRIVPAPEGVPQDETALIKALKAQVLAALAPA